MELIAQFENAVAASKLLPAKPDNETLLKLYSLYKQATEGDAPTEGPGNPFDFVGKAKHTAWAELTGKTKEEAMQDYVALIDALK
jgi:acyl-CoA-binding protein